jgi:hypothetical protein
MKYDMHIATEAGDSAALKQALSELEFRDDNLAERHLTFDAETGKHYSACPLIDVHVSKKIEARPELRELEIRVNQIMKQTNVTGYWHSEYIMADDHIDPQVPFALKPLPFARLSSRPRSEEKVWDIHLAFRESLMPPGLSETLIENGIYYIARLKKVPEGGEDRFAVYTVQGINRTKEGENFYLKFVEWLKAVGVPACDIKLELTTAMEVYNSPRLVPPTIEHIEWI